VATHANPCGAATTWVVSDNTWHVICFGFLGDLFSSFNIEIVLRHRTQSDFDDLNAQGCAFSGLIVATHHLGDQIPQNPHLGAWIGFFRPNVQNIETCILWKLLHRLQPNFAQHSSWVVQIRSKQIQDGGPLPFRKKVKSQYVRKNFDWFWCNLARCRKLFPVGDRLLKLWIFENPRWRRPPSWKSQKSRYRSYGLTDLREIWHADAECVS